MGDERTTIKKLPETAFLQAQIIDQVHDSVVSTDLDGFVTSWNRGAERLFGYKSNEAIGRHISFVYREELRDFLENHIIAPLKAKGWHEAEVEMHKRSGEDFKAHLTLSLLRDDQDTVIGMIGYTIDITQRVQAEEALRVRARQQEVVADLGQLALAGMEISALFDKAAEVVVQTLNVDFCKVLELMPDNGNFLLKAGKGWKGGYVHRAVIEGGHDSQAGYTLVSKEPVVVSDFNIETRFSRPQILVKHEVLSGMSVIIQGQERPFGVLGAHSTKARHFDKEDIFFLQAVANVLAEAIQRKRFEHALLVSEERFRTQYKGFPMPTYTWQKRGQDFILIDYNDAATAFTEGKIRDFLGIELSAMFSDKPDVIDDFYRCYTEKRVIKREMNYASRFTDTNGVFEISYVYIPPDLVMIHAEDITAKVEAEIEHAKLFEKVKSSRERLWNLTRQLVMAQETERRRISLELHDDAGQALTALKIGLELIQAELPKESEKIRQSLKMAVPLVDQTMNHIRLIARGLHPPELEAGGLEPALEDICHEFGVRTKMAVGFHSKELPELTQEVKIGFYRVLQEALTNVAKHAHASKVSVTVDSDGNNLRLAVEDDGQGFPSQVEAPDTEVRMGMGLLSMRERLELLGGRLEIESKSGRGTRLLALAPCQGAQT